MITASNEEVTIRNEREMIRLTEADIPGAKLSSPMDRSYNGGAEMVDIVLRHQSSQLME